MFDVRTEPKEYSRHLSERSEHGFSPMLPKSVTEVASIRHLCRNVAALMLFVKKSACKITTRLLRFHERQFTTRHEGINDVISIIFS